MQGITITTDAKGKTATITIDLTSDLGLSKSGKTRMVASTYGNTSIPGTDIKIGINAYRPVAGNGGK